MMSSDDAIKEAPTREEFAHWFRMLAHKIESGEVDPRTLDLDGDHERVEETTGHTPSGEPITDHEHVPVFEVTFNAQGRPPPVLRDGD